MVNFGNKLVALEHKPWSDFYLDYARLKDILESIPDEEQVRRQHILELDNKSIEEQGTATQLDGSFEFIHVLNREVEKILLFFLQEQGEIAASLAGCRRKHLGLISSSTSSAVSQDSTSLMISNNIAAPFNEDLDSLQTLYHEIALHLLHLIQYVDLNVTGIRKILKKHDKQLPNQQLAPIYLGRRGKPSILLQPLLADNDDSLNGLVLVLETSLRELKVTQQGDLPIPPPAPPVEGNPVTSTGRHFRRPSAPLLADFSVASLLESSSPRRLNLQYHSVKQTNHKSMVQLNRENPYANLPTDAIVLQIRAARSRLQQTSDFVQFLAASLMMSSEVSLMGEEEEEDDTTDEKAGQTKPSEFSNLLNLLSTFLYMTNYYIVAPSSGTYAVKLGGSAALSGIIIGMTPVAALVSTVLYSWWTSYSYKAALIFASSCSLIGNVLYATGLPYNSLALVMLGRLLNGFGSARSINRRYIADTFSRSQRTAASAAFVTAGALGMAAGPAVASLLHLTVSDSSLNLYWQVENSVGWFMAVAWAVYLVCLIMYFSDPHKKVHLASPKSELGEKKPLLTNGESDNNRLRDSGGMQQQDNPMWRNIPVMTTFWLYFVLKLVLECLLSSTSTLTLFYFGWRGDISGVYMAALGLLMLPANFVVAYFSKSYFDRELIMGLQVTMLLGCLIILQYSDNYSIAQYIVGSVIIFVSTNALEGPNMSLLSKTIPKSWAKGIFNIGLLATEAGTLGRAVGDVLLTACGEEGLQYLLNRSMGTMSLLSFVTLLVSYMVYDHLEPLDNDD
jgi:hypothetical protein